MGDRIAELIEQEKGIFLDLGCGRSKDPRAIGMDHEALPGVDIVHDLLDLPWPLPDHVCYRILASHIVEHLPPDRVLAVIAECHRVLKDHGQLLIATPYGSSQRALQDPTHYRGWIEPCFEYFDCDKPLWGIYRPPCFKIELSQWNSLGDLNGILAKRGANEHGQFHTPKPKD